MLEGSDDVVSYGGRVYRYDDMRKIFQEEGVFESMARNVESAIKLSVEPPKGFLEKTGHTIADWMEYVNDVGEGLQERERAGLALTLVELGAEPRVAARLATKTLFDYLTSTAPSERYLPFVMFFTYWSFTKNSNRAVINAFFDGGWSGHRLSLMRRTVDYSADAANELLYGYVTDPYGIDVDALTDEGYSNYLAMRATVEKHYGGVEKVPLDVRMAMRAIMAGGSSYIINDGKVWQLSTRAAEIARDSQAFQNKKSATEVSAITGERLPARMDTETAYIPKPDRSAEPSYLGGLTTLMIPLTEEPRQSRSEVSQLQQYMKMASPDHPFVELILPETYVQSAIRSVGSVVAFGILMAHGGINDASGLLSGAGPAVFDESGAHVATFKNAARQYVDPERAVLLPEVADLVFGMGEARPIRIHRLFGAVLNAGGISVASTKASDDPYSLSLESPNIPTDAQKAELKAATERNLLPIGSEAAGGAVIPQHYYLPPQWGVAIQSTPGLNELNTYLLQYNDYLDLHPGASPLERAASPEYARLLSAARLTLGIQVVEPHRSKVARQEETTRPSETKEPPKPR